MLWGNTIIFKHTSFCQHAEISEINKLHRDPEFLFPLMEDYVFKKKNSASDIFPGDAF